MAADDLVQRELWGGYIPCVFSLATHEVTVLEAPPPFYVMIPRQTYITLYTNEIKEHFGSSVTNFDANDEIWFEYNETPLKWHIPTGVLYDFLTNADTRYRSTTATIQSKTDSLPPKQLPWPITVHFRGFPANEVLRCPNDDAVYWQYFNTLKEASQVKKGTTAPIMNLSKNDQTALWNAVKDCNYLQFQLLNNQLFSSSGAVSTSTPTTNVSSPPPQPTTPVSPTTPTSADSSASSPQSAAPQTASQSQRMRGFPIRIYTSLSRSSALVIASQFTTASNEPVTLGMFLRDQIESNLKLGDDPAFKGITDPALLTVIIQGIKPPMDTPLRWLVENLMHPDNFLHICVLPPLK